MGLFANVEPDVRVTVDGRIRQINLGQSDRPVGEAAPVLRVEDERGGWLWLLCDASGRWFVHGEWV